MQQDSAPGVGPIPPDAATDTSAAAHLSRLYAVMERLSLIAETTTLGAVARAAQEAEQDLWPVIAHFGGDRDRYGEWQAALGMVDRELGKADRG